MLAVIVVLAIILAIAIPGISGIIKNSTKGSMKSDAKLLLNTINLKKLEDESFNPLDYNSDLAGLMTALNLNGSNYESVSFIYKETKLLVTITGKGKWAGLTACGSYQNMDVSEDGCELDLVSPVITLTGDNPMEIALGDTYTDPGANVSDNSGESIEVNVNTSGLNTNVEGEYTVTYTATDSSGNTTTETRTLNVIKTEFSTGEGVNKPKLALGMVPIKWNGSAWVDTTENDADWYNYTSTDKQWANARTADGSYWVWIPRYAYQIATNYHTTTAGTINIKFLKNTTTTASDNSTVALVPTYSGSSQTNYIKHPAFTFGTTELTGIWVAKFEASGTTSSLDSKPGVSSIRNITLGSMFTASRNMETNSKYGWALSSGLNADGTFATDTNNVDAHMMKNIEWGAAAYLAQSIYGKNAEVTVNSSSSYYTGGGTGSAYTTNVGQSTTGTIYGIYDMSGGSWEYVMGNLNNLASSSGLTPSTINDKYIDRYTAYENTKYGEAVYETSVSTSYNNSWYGDYSYMPGTGYPWFRRSGYYEDGSSAGTFFFNYYTGEPYAYGSWRTVLVTDTGL